MSTKPSITITKAVRKTCPRFDDRSRTLKYDEWSLTSSSHASETETLGILFLYGFGGNLAQLAHHASRVVEAFEAAQESGASCCISAVCTESISLMEKGSLREIWLEHSVRSAQVKNVQQIKYMITEHLKWTKFILVGHSAGGGIALESAVLLQQHQRAPLGLLLFDGVPFDETLAVVKDFNLLQTSICSIRAEPSAWNKEGLLCTALETIDKAADPASKNRLVDVMIKGSRHGDCLKESTWLLRQLGLFGCGQGAINDVSMAYVSDIASQLSTNNGDALAKKEAAVNELHKLIDVMREKGVLIVCKQ